MKGVGLIWRHFAAFSLLENSDDGMWLFKGTVLESVMIMYVGDRRLPLAFK